MAHSEVPACLVEPLIGQHTMRSAARQDPQHSALCALVRQLARHIQRLSRQPLCQRISDTACVSSRAQTLAAESRCKRAAWWGSVKARQDGAPWSGLRHAPGWL